MRRDRGPKTGHQGHRPPLDRRSHPPGDPDRGVRTPPAAPVRRTSFAAVSALPLTLAILALTVPRPFLLVFLLTYPSASLVRVTRRNLALSLPAIATMNIGAVILLGALLRVASIPLRHESFVVAAALIVGAITFARHRAADRGGFSWQPPDGGGWAFAVVYAVFAVALVSRVASTLGVIVPILQDPYAHTMMTLSILEGRTIDYFYAPGLHLLSALVVDGTGLSAPLAVHYTTNIANALSVLTWPLAAFVTFRSRTLSAALAVTMLLIPYPERLYVEQGKNAFILALALAPLVFVTVARVIERPSPRRGALLGAALLVILFSHQGAFVHTASIAGFALVAVLWVHRSTATTRRRLFVAAGSAALVVAAGIGLWLTLALWNFDIAADPLDPSLGADAPSAYPGRVATALHEARQALSSRISASGPLFVVLALASIPVVAASRRTTIRAGALLLPAAFVSTLTLVPLLGLGMLSYLSREAGTLYLFPVTAVPIAGAVHAVAASAARALRARAKRWGLGVTALALATTVAVHAGTTYADFSRSSGAAAMATVDDLAAFEWIEAELGDRAFVLNNGYQGGETRTHVIFPMDGAMWMPAFTTSIVLFDFRTFGTPETHESYRLYTALRSEDTAVEALRALNDEGFRHYYHSTRSVFGPEPLDIERISRFEGIVAERLFSHGTVSIYRLETDE
jgi:hypothetical protein